MLDFQQQDTNYALLGTVKALLNPYNLTVASYQTIVGKKYNLLPIIKQFINYYGIFQGISIVPQHLQEQPIDNDHEKPVFVQLMVHRDDISLIGSDSPIRISCYSDAFPSNKDSFLDFVKDLYDVMKQ